MHNFLDRRQAPRGRTQFAGPVAQSSRRNVNTEAIQGPKSAKNYPRSQERQQFRRQRQYRRRVDQNAFKGTQF